jgi:hypothetical protein
MEPSPSFRPPPRVVAAVVAVVVLAAVATAVWWGMRDPGRIAAPRPEVVDEEVEPPAIGSSTLSVPVRVELATLVEEMESAVPTAWGSLERRMEIPDNDRAAIAVELERSPFEASLVADTARVAAVIHYRLRAWYDPPVLPEVSASCGTGEEEPRPRLDVELLAPLSLSVGWALQADSRIAGVAARSREDRDRCEVTFLGIDVTGRVEDGARSFLQGHLETLDSLVATVDLRSSFQGWWDLLQEPVRLDDEVWLVMDPISVRRGAIRGEGGVVEVPVGLEARPRIVLGPRPDPPDRPLPALETGTVEPGLEILVEGRADYASASDRLTEELVGTELQQGERTVIIESLELSGIGGGRLALAVEITGDIDGRLYLVGTPRYDAESDRIRVPDLEFDVATSNLLVKGASWVAQVGLAQTLRTRARWPASPAVEWAGDRLREGLNRSLSETVRLEGEVEDVRILGVHAARDALRVRAAATARATLTVSAGR